MHLRTQQITRGEKTYVVAELGVPKDILDHLLEADISEFTVTLTEEGILYSPRRREVSVVPSWLKR